MADFVVLSMTVELHVPGSRSLKAKRSVIKHVVDGARRRWAVSAAELGRNESWQRTMVGFATVANSATTASEVMDAVERWVWTTPDAEVLETRRYWLDTA